MNSEEQNDPVWKLLDNSRQVSVQESFTAATMQAVQGVEQEKVLAAVKRADWEGENVLEFPKIKWGRLAAALTAAAALLVIGVRLALRDQPTPNLPPELVISMPGSLDPLLPDHLLLTSEADIEPAEAAFPAPAVQEDDSEVAEYAAVDHYSVIVSTEEPGNLSDEALLALLN